MTDEGIVDRVPRDAEEAREIGFAVAPRYNASEILFANLGAGRGERAAVYADGERWTYAALCARAARFGNALLGTGLAPGERVALFLDDTAQYPAAFFGAVRAGLVPILLNTLSTPDLLRFYLEDSGARAAIVEAAHAGRFNQEVTRGTALQTVVCVNGPPVPGSRQIDAEDWLADGSDALAPADTARDDMAFWMYSSGSTGRPKGVVHLQHDMAYTAQSYASAVLHLRPDDICFSVPKIFFAYGFGNSITFPFSVGAASVLYPDRPTPAAVFDQVKRHRPTVFYGLPTLYTSLVNDPQVGSADFSSVRLCVSAAEILSAEVFTAWQRRFGHAIVEGLGSTEVLHIYLSNTADRQKPGSAGRRVPGYALRLTDREGGAVGADEEGVLWVRGDSNAPCYWNRPEKTAETMREGWIWTGDRFAVDADGFYFFRGRADDLIKVSGQWVYPLEIERCLAEHPDVRECAVVGLELADRRMTLKAFVVLKVSPPHDPEAETEKLQRYVKVHLVPYKYPRLVEFVDELPKTGTDKIDRQALLRRPGCG